MTSPVHKDTQTRIRQYIISLNDTKRADLEILHARFLQLMPNAKRWFLDGTNDEGKIVSNPSIGYGQYSIHYKDGSAKEFYQVGLSANTAGISVYIMGLQDKKYLSDHFGDRIGKASVTGYCIKFRSLKDIEMDVLEEAVLAGIAQTGE